MSSFYFSLHQENPSAVTPLHSTPDIPLHVAAGTPLLNLSGLNYTQTIPSAVTPLHPYAPSAGTPHPFQPLQHRNQLDYPPSPQVFFQADPFIYDTSQDSPAEFYLLYNARLQTSAIGAFYDFLPDVARTLLDLRRVPTLVLPSSGVP